MAVLEKIRTKMGILISIVIGLSLLAFILTDFLTGGKSVFNGNQYELAKIAGKSVDYKEYEAKIQKLVDVYKANSGNNNISDEALQDIREKVWQQVVEENVMEDEYSDLGIEVSPREVLDMVEGPNPHPYVRQLFTNPETQQYNRAYAIQFIKSLDQDKDGKRKLFWLYVEGQIIRERLMTKYNNLLKNGLYVTSVQLRADEKINSKKVNFNFVSEKLNTVSDSAVTVSESDLESYLKNHKNEFQQESSRDIEYITYNVKPSQDDVQKAEKWIQDIEPEYKSTNDVKQFINLNSDIPFNEKYLKESELNDTLKPLFKEKVGYTFGPYFNNNTYEIARVVDFKELPDSVRASHILIRPADKTQEALAKAKATADSIFKLATKKGADFAALASANSADGSAKKGGDLGWFKEGAMVKEFSDACFNGKKGDIVEVTSQFGIHIIKITDKGKEQKKVQIGILARKLEPSNTTIQDVYQQASAFAGNNNTGDRFVAAVKKLGITPKSASYLNENMKGIPSIPNSREIIRWAFKANENDISGVLEFGNTFVIARLSSVREKGTAKLKQVLPQVEVAVKREKKEDMIADKISKQIAGLTSIDAIATKLGTTVESATDLTFNSYSIPGVGYEPKLIGTVTAIAPNKTTDPIKGIAGVYVAVVTNVSEQQPQSDDIQMMKMRAMGMYNNRVGYEAFGVLKKMADIQDERTKFY